MYQDIVFPNNNEKEFVDLSKTLGYYKIVFCYKEGIKKKNTIQSNQNINISHATLSKNPHQGKKTFTIYKADDSLRQALERGIIDMIFGLEEHAKKDKIHFRMSGLNQILCKIAKEKSISIAFSFNSVLKSFGMRRAIILGRMQQNVRLCRKYKLKMRMAGFATTPYDMRAPKDLISFGTIIGMHPKEAKEAISC